jgi:hypothetical protein
VEWSSVKRHLSITVYALNPLCIDHRIFYGDLVVIGGVLAKLATSPKRLRRAMADFCEFSRVSFCGKNGGKRPFSRSYS